MLGFERKKKFHTPSSHQAPSQYVKLAAHIPINVLPPVVTCGEDKAFNNNKKICGFVYAVCASVCVCVCERFLVLGFLMPCQPEMLRSACGNHVSG